MVKQIFVNLSVKDLQKSIEFFTKLGFTFNPQFTDENATCMIISENIFAMLLVEHRFKDFTKKEIIDASKQVEVLNALSVGSREEVDALLEKALAAGATEPMPPQDHGWMYSRDFEDLYHHVWEVFYGDEKALAEATI
ncbi:MAG TPA: VOC family protein [Candidatus Magasanikbacteria bacterium]|nr:VOC family protein [Candidatus Magasanikbacteria bacterium]